LTPGAKSPATPVTTRALGLAVAAGVMAALSLLAPEARAATQRTDVVVMTNGDRVTGEIEKLFQGQLQLKTDHAGTIEFEWPSVLSIESRNSFEVVLDDGRRLYGSLRALPARELEVVGANTQRAHLHAVVEITPLGRSFWAQLAGSMSLGFSFSQSNESTTWTASADVEYLTRKYLLALSASSYLDAQSGTDTNTRNDLGATVGRLFARRWRLVEMGELFQSDQLGIRRQTSLGIGVEHDVVNTNRNLLSPSLGVAYSNTAFQDETPSTNEILARLGLRYAFFTFGHHKTSLSASLYALPSLSDWGHFRLNVNGRFRIKLFQDFYWSLDVYENYDNNPSQGSSDNDSGGSASLAWTF
jgi:hypothetical protein